MTPSVTHSGAPVRSFPGRGTNCRSNSTPLAATATESTLSLLRQLGFYTKASLPYIVYHIFKQESILQYAYATTNISRRSAREKAEKFRNTFEETMTLLATTQWKAALDKEWASLGNNNDHTLLPMTFLPSGDKVIGFRWVFKIQGDDSKKKGRTVV